MSAGFPERHPAAPGHELGLLPRQPARLPAYGRQGRPGAGTGPGRAARAGRPGGLGATGRLGARTGEAPPALIAAPVALAALIVLAALAPVPGHRRRTASSPGSRYPPPGAGGAQPRRPPAGQLARGHRAPGQVFAFYKWGGTVDSILPRLTSKPVAVRYETPYSDLHADDLLVTIDNLVQQDRLFGGQLGPLLGLIGARSLIQGTDDDITRSGAVDPAVAALGLSTQGLGAPRNYGPVSSVPLARGSIDPVKRLAEVRQFSLPAGRGIVHLDQGPDTILDGSAQGLADLAAFGALPARAPILYAGDLTRSSISRDAASGANVVITDSNRRQVFSPQFTQQDFGPVLTAGQPITSDEADLNPFPAQGTERRDRDPGPRRCLPGGALGLWARPVPRARPDRRLRRQPEHELGPVPQPRSGPAMDPDRLHRPRDVPYVDIFPLVGPQATVKSVAIDGRVFPVAPGGTRIPLHAHDISSLRIALAHVDAPQPQQRPRRPARDPDPRRPCLPGPASAAAGQRRAGRTRSQPRLADLGVRAPDRRRSVPRQPLRRRARPERSRRRPGSRGLHRPAARLARAPRSYSVDARRHPRRGAPDSAFDTLSGVRTSATFTSSSRFDERAALPRLGRLRRRSGHRVGRAVDPSVRRLRRGSPGARRDPLTVRRLRITPARQPVRRPTEVQLSWPGGSSPPLPVGPAARSCLPRPVRARAFRLTILDARSSRPG